MTEETEVLLSQAELRNALWTWVAKNRPAAAQKIAPGLTGKVRFGIMINDDCCKLTFVDPNT